MRSARVDANHGEVKADFETFLKGCTVVDLKGVGEGCPDIMVGWRGRTYLFEIKVPGKRLNERQTQWHNNWQGHAATITSAAEGIASILETETK